MNSDISGNSLAGRHVFIEDKPLVTMLSQSLSTLQQRTALPVRDWL